MKIAISTRWVGGAGGVERNVWSMVQALRGHDIVVFTQHVIPSELLPSSSDCSIRLFDQPKPWPWTILRRVFPLWRSLVPPPEGHFDLYIHLRQGLPLHHVITAGRSVIIPSGSPIGNLAKDFEFVLSQAADGEKFTSYGLPHRIVPPPYVAVCSEKAEVHGLPDAFFLTVFNPYDPLKGADILKRTADHLSLPLVWCYSDRTLAVSESEDFNHPNVVRVHDPTQAELNYLYSKCAAYICYSRSEGFGWSIVDALAHSKPVISREIGVVTLVSKQRGISLYSTEEELAALIEQPPGTIPEYDLDVVSARRFRETLESLTDT